MLETSRMSAQEYPGISLQALQSGKYRYFQQELGRQVAYSRHTVTPILADEATAKAFGIPAGTAAFAGREHHLSGLRPHPGLYRAGVQRPITG